MCTLKKYIAGLMSIIEAVIITSCLEKQAVNSSDNSPLLGYSNSPLFRALNGAMSTCRYSIKYYFS